MSTIAIAKTEQDIRRCFPVVVQLRPHLSEDEFIQRVKRQQKDGYQLAFLEEGEMVIAVTGYRVLETLWAGRCFYVDDLVTAEAFRSQGFGQRLFQWLVEQARGRDCVEFHLDSGVQRFGAHRFYLASGMDIVAHHFGMRLR